MFSQKIMGRKMFQEGGMATPSVPSSVTGGGIVEGLGLNEPEAMPPIPPQDQEMITEGMADIAGKLGQVDAAEDTASLINAIRSDNQPLDARYTELANYVGRKDATATPESVLTLVQPTFELMEQGGGMGMLGSDMLQGAAPMEESMTATMTESPMGDTATMTETMETPNLFNGGGLVKKSKAPVYRQQGSPPQGENIFGSTYETSPYRFGDMFSQSAGTPPNPYSLNQPQQEGFNAGYEGLPYYTRRGMMSDDREAQIRADLLKPPEGDPSYNDMVAAETQKFYTPRQYTEAGIGETLREGTVPARSETEIYEGYKDLAEGEEFLTTKPAEDYRIELEALMSPYREEPQTREEMLKEREDFVGTVDNRPEALFALAQGFNEMAQTPGKFLGSLAAGSAKAAELLAPLSREQQVFDLQRKQRVFDEERALSSRIREDQRQVAASAWEMFREDEKGTKAFKQGMFTDALRQAAIEAQTEQELNTKIKEIALEMGVDLRTAQIDAIQGMYEPMLDPIIEGDRIYKLVPNENGDLMPKLVGRVGEDANDYYNQRHSLRGGDPMVILAEEGAPPAVNLAGMSTELYDDIKTDMYNREIAINSFEDIFQRVSEDSGRDIGTGPRSWVKAVATNSLGAFGADWATWIGNEENRRDLIEAVRAYTRAESMNPRFPVAEQTAIREMLDLEPEFWKDPETAWHRVRNIAVDLINRNEFDHAIMERRPPAKLALLASGTKNDPIDYGNAQFRDMLGLMGEQGRNWAGYVDMTAEDATLADPRINPFGAVSMSRLQELHQDPANSDLNLDGLDKYARFAEENNPIKIFLELGKKPDGTVDFGFEQVTGPGTKRTTDFGFKDRRYIMR